MVGHIVSCDYVPVSIIDRGGFRGYYLFREAKCGYIMAVLVSNSLKTVMIVKTFFAQHGHQLRVLMVDAGTVENSVATKQKLNLEGITIQTAAPECQFQNPVERTQQTVANALTAALCDQNMLDNTR